MLFHLFFSCWMVFQEFPKHNKNKLCTRWSWREPIQKAKHLNFIRAIVVLRDLSVSGLVDPTSGSTVLTMEYFRAAHDWLFGAPLRRLWACEVCMLLLDPKALFTDLIDLRQICIGKGIPVFLMNGGQANPARPVVLRASCHWFIRHLMGWAFIGDPHEAFSHVCTVAPNDFEYSKKVFQHVEVDLPSLYL